MDELWAVALESRNGPGQLQIHPSELNRYGYAEISPDSEYFNYVAQFVTKSNTRTNSLLRKFSSLKSLELDGYWEFRYLPGGLEKLSVVLNNFIGLYKIPVLSSYIRSLNSTLRVLEIRNFREYNCLSDLHNLEEIKITNDIPIDDVIMMLIQNVKLQRIQISFVYEELRGGWMICESISLQISALKDLKELSLVYGLNSEPIATQSTTIFADLLMNVGPQLSKLTLSADFLYLDLKSLVQAGSLTNIKEFKLIKHRFNGEALPGIHPIIWSMKSLQKLRRTGQLYNNMHRGSELILLIKSLPCLLEIEFPVCAYAIRFEMELREYLEATNRELLLNTSKLMKISVFLCIFLMILFSLFSVKLP